MLRLSEPIAFLSFAAILSQRPWKTVEASSSFVSSRYHSRTTEFWIGGCHVDLTWKGSAKFFRLSANIYLKLLFLAKLLKYFTTDLLELIRNRRGWYKFWLQRYWANKHLYCWSCPLLLRHESWSKSYERRNCGLIDFVMHQSYCLKNIFFHIYKTIHNI